MVPFWPVVEGSRQIPVATTTSATMPTVGYVLILILLMVNPMVILMVLIGEEEQEEKV